MKYINSIRWVNRVLMIITLLLYVTIILGVCFQIVLGAFQLIIGIIILFYWKRLSEVARTNMLIYFGAVFLFGVLWIVGVFKDFNEYWYIPCAVVPMIMAFCFTIFLEELKLKE